MPDTVWRRSTVLWRTAGHWRWKVPTAILPLIALTTAFVVFGLALLFQPERWERTPAYANLLALFPQSTWGVIYLFVAVLGVLSIPLRRARWVAVIAHAAYAGLVVCWLVAFIIRYLTDDATTPVTAVAWMLMLSLVAQSALQLDEWDEIGVDPRSVEPEL